MKETTVLVVINGYVGDALLSHEQYQREDAVVDNLGRDKMDEKSVGNKWASGYWYAPKNGYSDFYGFQSPPHRNDR
jgi:hypothetical protein